MTSREIAELTGKDLSHIHRDTRAMLDELAESDDPDLDHVCEEKDSRGYTTCFHLPKGLTFTLMAGYSVKMRHTIIRRWQELEAQVATPFPAIPQTLAQALRLAADQAEQIEQQQVLLAIAAPKAAFVDKYVDSTGLKGFREVAKLLKVTEPKFRAFLTNEKIMYRLGGEWAAYAQHLDAGRFEVKTGASSANGHAFNRTMFTGKGVEWIAGLWAVHCLKNEVAA